ncbi:MAG TPA: Rab family GTPase [Spirochaetota bacterium]|nr:GTP-binding protein [Spirochaetota bacterium]HOD15515.1 Rab family GTPase [Spirochaetota bacterium]HPG52446.1 Rab family GTPase [Spirochaetota bacterium]HPN13533.1 Rab family GTPase [Spirochaetota bacterium]HQL83520.1 Rab family GTPase [Spirochaetota bacterium]
MTSDNKYKIIMLGDFAVGKTSLVKRYVLDQFDDLYLTTIGVKVMKKEIVVPHGGVSKNVTMLLWDVGGIFDAGVVMTQYLQGARGAVVVVDLTRITRISSIEGHIREYRAINPDGFLVIAFNKCDVAMSEDFKGSIDNIIASYASRYSVTVLKTSAKTGENVETLFTRMASGILGS